MAGLGPAIHVLAAQEGVDARHKAGHDDREVSIECTLTTDFAKPDSSGTRPGMTTETVDGTEFSSSAIRERELGAKCHERAGEGALKQR
jgi:hypothetical protein